MKRQRIQIDGDATWRYNRASNSFSRLSHGTTVYNATRESGEEYTGQELREIPLLSSRLRLASLLGHHWPGTRRYRVNRLAFKLQRALKYLLFNIRHGLTKRLDWYGERLNALQTNETLGDL